MKYNHAFDIAFEVESNKEDASDVTQKMLAAAIQRRLNNCVQNNSLEECCFPPFDSYEIPQ